MAYIRSWDYTYEYVYNVSDFDSKRVVRHHPNGPETIGKPGAVAAAFARVNEFISSAVNKYVALHCSTVCEEGFRRLG